MGGRGRRKNLQIISKLYRKRVVLGWSKKIHLKCEIGAEVDLSVLENERKEMMRIEGNFQINFF